MRRTTRLAALALVASVALAGCGSSKNNNPLTQPTTTPPQGTVTIGAFNFPESTLLANIYGKALEAKGIKTDLKLNIGAREVVYDQIKSGGLTLVPEYNGALLNFIDKTATQSSSADVNTALKAKLPLGLEILDSAAAEDKDSLTVTADTASKYNLKAIPDLAPVASKFVLGAPPEFKTRPQGIAGLKNVYNLTFKSFKPLDEAGPLTVQALKKGQVQVANLFTTDPSIVSNGFVVLQDPQNLFGAQNVTPLVYKAGVNDTVTSTLNAVSAKLDTATLADLVKQVVADKKDADQVAATWLQSVGLG